MAAGVRETERKSERDAEPQPQAAYSNADPTGSPFAGRGMAGFGSNAVPSGSSRIGAADLNSPSNAGVQAPTQAPSYSSEQTAPVSDEYPAAVSDETLGSPAALRS